MEMNIGLIGAGTIGKFLLDKINQEQIISNYQITAVFDDRASRLDHLTKLGEKYQFTVYDHLDEFLESSVDIVVESANVAVLQEYARKIIRKKDLLLISVGALSDVELYEDLQSITSLENRKIYLPSGAIGGLDVLRSANVLGGLETVELITRKPAQAFSLDDVTEAEEIFSGTAKEAITHYPKNANISIIISLSGIGIERTKVRIIADPMVRTNVHTLKANGDFGKLELKLENNPSPDNPKTSYLTALSILSSLRSLNQTITIG